MAYKALYRTYRPSTFEEVAGQQHIVKTLKNALATNKIAHAYLFAGPRGTGKTTMAKLFAKALNCDEGIGHQCNKCKNCVGINDGSHPDVLEIDAASNRGIDEIRNLIDRVKYGAVLGTYKVYIIDEVHMLTKEAFNALLKTLEEPPEKVVFILATTEPNKLLPTILSRCQRYDFKKVSDDDIRDRIKIILESEKIEYNETAVNAIISLADGGMRDALSLLDQVLAYSGNKLDEQDVLDIFALESREEKVSLIRNIADNDVLEVINHINNYIAKGTDIKRLTNDILLILKDTLIYEYTHRNDFFEIINEENAKELSSLFSSEQLLRMIDVLTKSIVEYKNITDINPLFQVTLLKLVSVANEEVTSEPVVKEKVIEIKKTPEIRKNNEFDVETPVVKEEQKPVENNELVKDLAPNTVQNEHFIYPTGFKDEGKFALDYQTMINIMVTSKKEYKNEALDNWKNIKKYATHPTLGKVSTILADSYPLVVANKIIVVEVQFPKASEKINAVENQLDLQNLLETIFKRKMFVYAVSRKESVELQQNYRNLYEIKKLPRVNEVQIDFSEE